MWRTQLRLVASVALAKARPVERVFEPTEASYLAKPYEADLNFHINHEMYLKYFSRAQGSHFLHTRYIGLLYLRGWSNFIAATHLGYLRATKPFEPLRIMTQLTGCDEKYVYCEQAMSNRRGLVATATQRMVIVDARRQRLAPAEALANITSEPVPSPPVYREAFHAIAAHWRGRAPAAPSEPPR